MVSEGITRARLPAGNAVICTLDDPAVPALAQSMRNTRSAAALELWRPHLDGAIVAIGNAPTALFHLLNMLEDDNCPRPAAIIGCPVGFVGAAESKAALMAIGAGAGADRRGPARRLRDHGRRRERAGEQERIDHGADHLLRARTRRSRPDERARRSRGARRNACRLFPQEGPARPGAAHRRGHAGARRARISDGISGHDRACRSTAAEYARLLGGVLR